MSRPCVSSPDLTYSNLKRRGEGILEAITHVVLRLPPSGDGVRAIEVLEQAGTPEAREPLQAWAEQAQDLRLAAEARIAGERINSANPNKGSSAR